MTERALVAVLLTVCVPLAVLYGVYQTCVVLEQRHRRKVRYAQRSVVQDIVTARKAMPVQVRGRAPVLHMSAERRLRRRGPRA